MGHRHTSAHLGRDGEIRRDRDRAAPHFAAGREHAGDVTPARAASGVARAVLLFGVRVYRAFFSPFFGGNCKFYPSCSVYAQEAIAKHGARRGAWLAFKRLLRCRPFTKGGFDPVPDSPDFEFHPVVHGEEPSR